ncbi:MAG TPA: phosphohistidine phosphatase SixA [Candidatus Bathyarchaeia archaeon]|nr:phosphohistidine phosphatase SixA [Candidatus Bathyarchaeia archaeon]
MKLFLVRHGDYVSADPAHPLSLKGVQDIENIGGYLKNDGVHVSQIWHSPKSRAVQTANIINDILNGGEKKERQDLLPNAHPQQVIEDLQSQEHDVLIVSHLPFIPRLVLRLLQQEDGQLFLFPMASVARLDFSKPAWLLEEIITPDFFR